MSFNKTLGLFSGLWIICCLLILFKDSQSIGHFFNPYCTGWNPIWDERIPRIIVLSLTGAMLATSGASLQAVFGNPLASPSCLGITAAGTVSALLLCLFAPIEVAFYGVPIAALIGCLASLFAIYTFYRIYPMALQGLLLIGLALATFFASVQGILEEWASMKWPPLPYLNDWMHGSSWDKHWFHVYLIMPFGISGFTILWSQKTELDLLSLGENQAKSLGVVIDKTRWLVFFAVSMLVGATLGVMGPVPFIGLLLPHLVRKLSFVRMPQLLVLSSILGALFLVFIDWILNIFCIYQITLGQAISFLGGLGFLVIYSRTNYWKA